MSEREVPSTKSKQRKLVDELILVLTHGIESKHEPSLRSVLDGLKLLRGQLHNRSPVARGRISADKVTPAMRAEVLRMRQQQPEMSAQEIAVHLNLNVGRTSEIIRGKRT